MGINLNPKEIDLAKVGIVVPTLGNRPSFLQSCLESIIAAGCTNISIVGPKEKIDSLKVLNGYCADVIQDPGFGLPEAINRAISQFSKEIEFIAWLGDDDLIAKDSLSNSLKIFTKDTDVVATYGSCIYIDDNGNEILKNKSGQWASRFMNFLPNLIPQPGSLIKREAYSAVNGLKSDYPLSFDFELFFNLRKLGKLVYVPKTQGFFRWHPDSLSVEYRTEAVNQTSEIRVKFLPKRVKPFAILWEPLIKYATIFIGQFISRKRNN